VPLAMRDGVLTISSQKNGPLLVEGSVEIVSGTGRTMNRTTKAFLCRCGHSANKPYCDGTHKSIGFKSE
jgi:CDGSH-type Zn-finger protein